MTTTDNSWVLITGASSGFGEQLARQYAEKGHSLVLVASKNPHTGKPIFAGLITSGTEGMPMNWPLWVLGASPGQSAHAGFGISCFRDVVFERSDWQLQSMDFDRDVRISNEKVAPILSATSPDLRSFRARGGRLIQYHGWGDAAIAAPTSIEYYEAVRSFMSSAPVPA